MPDMINKITISVVFQIVVGDYTNIMKTTFDLNFDLYQTFKEHGYTTKCKQREVFNLKGFSLFTSKLVIWKKSC